MTTTPRTPHGAEPNKEQTVTTEGPDGEVRDADGLIVDEYSDASIEHELAPDALEDPATLMSEEGIDDAADGGAGIEDVDPVEASADAELLDEGGQHVGLDHRTDDEIDEAHSAEDLERATVGHATRLTDGPDGTQMHGEQFLDSPDKATPAGAPRPARKPAARRK